MGTGMPSAQRRELLEELNQSNRELGMNKDYDWQLLESWQDKVTLYQHLPSYTVEGKVWKPCGTKHLNQVGDPQHLARKAKAPLAWLIMPWDGVCKMELQGKECACKKEGFNEDKDKVTQGKTEVKVETPKQKATPE